MVADSTPCGGGQVAPGSTRLASVAVGWNTLGIDDGTPGGGQLSGVPLAGVVRWRRQAENEGFFPWRLGGGGSGDTLLPSVGRISGRRWAVVAGLDFETSAG
jgi:hypothetical protein